MKKLIVLTSLAVLLIGFVMSYGSSYTRLAANGANGTDFMTVVIDSSDTADGGIAAYDDTITSTWLYIGSGSAWEDYSDFTIFTYFYQQDSTSTTDSVSVADTTTVSVLTSFTDGSAHPFTIRALGTMKAVNDSLYSIAIPKDSLFNYIAVRYIRVDTIDVNASADDTTKLHFTIEVFGR